MHDNLLAMLLENGLVQFGRFEHDGKIEPILLNLELLPSYPETLRFVVEQAALKIEHDIERLVCPSDSLALGIGVSLQKQIPLVYSRGKGELPVHDLVGAYDVGHPAVLVMNLLQDVSEVEHFIAQALKVGLHIHHVFAVLSIGEFEANNKSYTISVLMSLSELVSQIEQQGHVAHGQANAVREWMNS
jgi:hypothetical protein